MRLSLSLFPSCPPSDPGCPLTPHTVPTVVLSLQDPVRGSFAGDEWNEQDSRFSYCAVSCLSLLGRLDALDKAKTVRFLEACRNFDGGFGRVEGAESHAAYGASRAFPACRSLHRGASLTREPRNFAMFRGHAVWTCVGALAMLDRLDLVDADTLCWWLCERQLPCGGLNGRPEKLEDVRPLSSAEPLFRRTRRGVEEDDD